MRIVIIRIAVFLLGGLAWGLDDLQSRLPLELRESPQGKFLELVDLEGEWPKRLVLLEQFVTIFPSGPALEWVYAEMQEDYLRARKYDKVIQLGEKILALNADQMSAASRNWSAAEALKSDPEMVKKWSNVTGEIARRVVKLPVPADPKKLAEWKERVVASGKVIDGEDERHFVEILSADEPKQVIAASVEFLHKNPKSLYVLQTEVLCFFAYKELNDVPNSLAKAGRILEQDATREDVLAFVVDWYARNNPQDKSLIEQVRSASTGTSPGRGRALFLIGKVYLDGEQFDPADRSLRAALTLSEGDQQLRASILDSLGQANYKLKRFSEALSFYRQCLEIDGPYRARASLAVTSIESEAQHR